MFEFGKWRFLMFLSWSRAHVSQRPETWPVQNSLHDVVATSQHFVFRNTNTIVKKSSARSADTTLELLFTHKATLTE